MNIDDYKKRLSYLSFAILFIVLIDLLIVLLTPMKKSFPPYTSYFVLVSIGLVFYIWIMVTDAQWRFGMLFVGGATAMEYLAKLAGMKNASEAKFIAVFGVLLLVFTFVSFKKFRSSPFYRVYQDEKGYLRLKIAIAALAVHLVVSNIVGI